MPAAVGPRFVLEAGFLVLLAVVVGFADLDPWLIILVMALGWLLVSLIEYFAWRQAQAVALVRYEAPPPPSVEEVAPPPPPPPPAPQPAADEETVVAPPASEPPPAEPEQPPAEQPPAEPEQPPAEPEPRSEEATSAFQPASERRIAHRLEPLQPAPRRRWILFGPYERRPESPAEGDSEEEQ